MGKMKTLTILFAFSFLLISCGLDPLNERTKLRQHEDDQELRRTTICPNENKPVCGHPPMPDCGDGFDIACPTVMPDPIVYKNRCELQLAGGYFIKDGNCPSGGGNGCGDEHKPVCGHPPMPDCDGGTEFSCLTVMPDPIVFKNLCELEAAGGYYIQDGDCPGHGEGACPAIYAPVCGQPPMPNCEQNDMGISCLTVMPQPETYQNRCVLDGSNAEFLYDGHCD